MADSANILSSLIEKITVLSYDDFQRSLQSLRIKIQDLKTKDNKNCTHYSVFHKICSSDVKEENLLKFIQISYDYVFYNQIKEANSNDYTTIVASMLNEKTIETGRTPVMEAIPFAKLVIYNKDIVRKYKEMGADCTILDNEGQSVLHLCVIFGQLPLMAYFIRDAQLCINMVDRNGRTALHVASFEGKEAICCLLIAWTDDFEIKDKDGFTPLHLAAFANSYRIVRLLIMRGASRLALSPEYTPEKIGQIMDISNDVRELLQEPSWFESINPISPAVNKASNTITTFMLNVCIFLIRYFITVFIIFAYLGPALRIISACVGFLGLITLFAASAIEPGYQQKGGNLADLYRRFRDEEKICPYCEVEKKESMKHCQRCNKCVKRFDHHCPWIHNCVGEM